MCDSGEVDSREGLDVEQLVGDGARGGEIVTLVDNDEAHVRSHEPAMPPPGAKSAAQVMKPLAIRCSQPSRPSIATLAASIAAPLARVAEEFSG